MSDVQDLNKRLVGLEPWESAFSCNANNRSASKFTYHDLHYNVNSFPFVPDMAIIVTSWEGQLKWLKATLTNYRLTGKFVILSYDNPIYPWHIGRPFERIFPRDEQLLLTHAFVMKHKTYDADKRTGWFWDVKYAQGIISLFPNIKYVYCTNGDIIWDKPEGADDLVKVLGDGDLMSGQSTPGGTIHTASLLMKVDAFHKILNYMTERMKADVLGGHSPECMIGDAVKMLRIKETFAPKQPRDADGNVDYYTPLHNDSTYKDIVGYRNLFAELEYAAEHELDPIPAKYSDMYADGLYFTELEKVSLYQYYKTGDRRYIKMWHDRSRDSGKIIIQPVEYYGKEPIWE